MACSIKGISGTHVSDPGSIVPLDHEKAFEFYSTLGGEPLRATEYRTSEKVQELWAQVVLKSDPKAMACLGAVYMLGCEAAPKNLQQAFTLFNRAADLGDHDALIYQLWIALASNENKDVRIAAIDRVIKAAARSVPVALYVLGRMYYASLDGLPRDQSQQADLVPHIISDWQKGVELLVKAAELGNSFALVAIANLAETNSFAFGFPTFTESERLCTRAIEAGNPHGYSCLARLYFDRDRAKAIEYYRQGAEVGDLESMIWVAEQSKSGRQVPQNVDKAIELFKKCAEYGHLSSMDRLSEIYVEQRCGAQALTWHKIAYMERSMRHHQRQPGGNPSLSALMIAYLYEIGLNGLPANPKRAAKWYGKCAELGNRGGMGKLIEKLCSGTGTGKDKREASRWLLFANSGKSRAQVPFGGI